jgi:hypothetical protein
VNTTGRGGQAPESPGSGDDLTWLAASLEASRRRTNMTSPAAGTGSATDLEQNLRRSVDEIAAAEGVSNTVNHPLYSHHAVTSPRQRAKRR